MTLETTAPPSSKAEVLHGVCLVSIRAYMTNLGRRYSVLWPRIIGPFCHLEFLPCHTKEIRVTVQCVHHARAVRLHGVCFKDVEHFNLELHLL